MSSAGSELTPFFPSLSLESFSEDEWNLLYVAVTRAKKRLIMTKSLENILTLAGVRGISSTSYFSNIQSLLGLSKGSVCDLGRPLVQDPRLAEKGFFWGLWLLQEVL